MMSRRASAADTWVHTPWNALLQTVPRSVCRFRICLPPLTPLRVRHGMWPCAHRASRSCAAPALPCRKPSWACLQRFVEIRPPS